MMRVLLTTTMLPRVRAPGRGISGSDRPGPRPAWGPDVGSGVVTPGSAAALEEDVGDPDERVAEHLSVLRVGELDRGQRSGEAQVDVGRAAGAVDRAVEVGRAVGVGGRAVPGHVAVL